MSASDLEQRAQMYAALGDPRRLGIFERLSVADAACGELGAELGIPTNLLAHHLRVLEEAGLIRRVRSEGDGRRTYVSLRLDDRIVGNLAHRRPGTGDPAPSGPGATDLGSASRVVFVCTHNSARSQLAAAVWAGRSATPAASAGTHPARRVHPRAVAVGRRHGLRLSQATTAHTDDILRQDDLVVAVCDRAHEALAHRGPAAVRERLHWSVPDPVRNDTDDAFEAAYQEIVTRVDRLVRAVQPERLTLLAKTARDTRQLRG